MDSVVAILKDGKVLNTIYFAHEPSMEEINQFVDLHGGTEGRKLTEYEGVNHNQDIEEKIQPYPSWTWDSATKQWLPPVAPPPIDEVNRIAYTVWNEDDKTWQVAE